MDDFFKTFSEPSSSGKKQARAMMTSNATASAIKAPQSKGGVACPMCDHHHKPGNQCSYMKSVEGLFDINKSGSPTVPGIKRAAPGKETAKVATGTGGGIPGHTGGNPHHGKDGRFTTANAAATVTPAKGKPAVPVEKKGKARPIKANSEKASEYWAGRNAKSKEKKQRAKDGNHPFMFDDSGTSVANPHHDPSKPVGQKKPKGPSDRSKTNVLPAKPIPGWSPADSAETSGFTPKVPVDRANTAKETIAPGAGAGDNRRTRIDTAPAGDKSSDQSRTVPSGLESLFDDIEPPAPTGAKPLDGSKLGQTSVDSPKPSPPPDGAATGAASPTGAKKRGGKVAGEEQGSGGVTGKTPDTDPNKTAAGGAADDAYYAARDKHYKNNPKDKKNIKGGSNPEGWQKDMDAWNAKQASPIGPQDYDRAHIQLTQDAGLQARRAAKQAGANPMQQNLAEFEAVQHAGEAIKLAKERGIPAHQIAGNHLKGLMEEVRASKTAPVTGSQPNQSSGVDGLFDDMQAQPQEGSQPLSGDQFGSPPSTPPTGGQPPGDDFDSPLDDAGGSGGKFPQGTKPQNTVDPKAKRGGGLPIAQMYGAGSSIGSGVAGSPGGGVQPTTAFAAQRVHGLLNPNLNPGKGPALAAAGQGGGRAAWSGATQSGKGHMHKSLEDLLNA